jgi:predicted DNA-binding WGR domain protein
MKSVYLENTNDHHNKYYEMNENPDGASFTASWGKIGFNGGTQIYGMNEWDMKYQEKINKGYKDIINSTQPSNWIQGMSVAQRKKLGITTVQPVQPLVRPKKANKKIHYDVGQVDIVVDHSHMNKLRILHMTMNNWEKNNGQLPMDSQRGRLYEADLHKVEELTERGTETMLESDTEFLGTSEFLTKEEMIDMNILFKTYGGKRVTE